MTKIPIRSLKIRWVHDADATPDYLRDENSYKQDGCSDADAKKHARQDKRQLNAWKQGKWHFVGCFIEAQVAPATPQGGYGPIQTLRSSGFWGIESDSKPSYLNQIAADEVQELKSILAMYNVEISNFDALAETELQKQKADLQLHRSVEISA